MISRISRIEQLLFKLKLGNGWYKRHENNWEGVKELIRRSQPLFDKLEQLGVPKEFSEGFLIFGPKITRELLEQFENN
jgi:hypothetical protein